MPLFNIVTLVIWYTFVNRKKRSFIQFKNICFGNFRYCPPFLYDTLFIQLIISFTQIILVVSHLSQARNTVARTVLG